jgi:hypothetical protein
MLKVVKRRQDLTTKTVGGEMGKTYLGRYKKTQQNLWKSWLIQQ